MGAFFYFPCQTKICVHHSQASTERLTPACANDQSLFLSHQIALYHFKGQQREVHPSACWHTVHVWGLPSALGVQGSTGRVLPPAKLWAGFAGSLVTLVPMTWQSAASKE